MKEQVIAAMSRIDTPGFEEASRSQGWQAAQP